MKTFGYILVFAIGLTAFQAFSAEAKYFCSMHPHITSEEPGRCSICGMDLVLIEEEEEEEEEPVKVEKKPEHSSKVEPEAKAVPGHIDIKLSLKKQQMIGVQITKPQKKKLFKSVRAPGRIAFDPELYTAQSEYLESLKQWRRVKDSPLSDVKQSTREMIRSAKIRLRVMGLSDDQIKRLTRQGSQSEGLLVTGKGQVNWVYADVFEMDLPNIKKGLQVQISANFLQGKVLEGKVVSVDQVINPDTRTAKVRIQLIDTDAAIRPDSYVSVNILAPLGEHLSIPLESILDTGRETYVFVKKGKGNFEPRRVTILRETDDDAAIGSGLSLDEEIVVGGNFMLDSESRLKAVIRGQ